MSLKELLGEELYSKVQEKIGDDKVFLASENDGQYVPKKKFDEKIEEANNRKDRIELLKEQLAERDKQLDQLKNDTQASEELKNKIEELEKKNDETEKEWQERLEKERLNADIDKTLLREKARNPKAVKALMDTEKIKEAEDRKTEIESQLEEIKKTDDYLFGETGLKGEDVETGDGPVDDDIKNNPWEPGKVNLTKQAEILNNNPGKAKSLIEKAGGNPSDYGLS